MRGGCIPLSVRTGHVNVMWADLLYQKTKIGSNFEMSNEPHKKEGVLEG